MDCLASYFDKYLNLKRILSLKIRRFDGYLLKRLPRIHFHWFFHTLYTEIVMKASKIRY